MTTFFFHFLNLYPLNRHLCCLLFAIAQAVARKSCKCGFRYKRYSVFIQWTWVTEGWGFNPTYCVLTLRLVYLCTGSWQLGGNSPLLFFTILVSLNFFVGMWIVDLPDSVSEKVLLYHHITSHGGNMWCDVYHHITSHGWNRSRLQRPLSEKYNHNTTYIT